MIAEYKYITPNCTKLCIPLSLDNVKNSQNFFVHTFCCESIDKSVQRSIQVSTNMLFMVYKLLIVILLLAIS